MGKNYVSEIFGYPSSNKNELPKLLRSKCLCPFHGNQKDGFE